jgi:hypothetical protein
MRNAFTGYECGEEILIKKKKYIVGQNSYGWNLKDENGNFIFDSIDSMIEFCRLINRLY